MRVCMCVCVCRYIIYVTVCQCVIDLVVYVLFSYTCILMPGIYKLTALSCAACVGNDVRKCSGFKFTVPFPNEFRRMDLGICLSVFG